LRVVPRPRPRSSRASASCDQPRPRLAATSGCRALPACIGPARLARAIVGGWATAPTQMTPSSMSRRKARSPAPVGPGPSGSAPAPAAAVRREWSWLISSCKPPAVSAVITAVPVRRRAVHRPAAQETSYPSPQSRRSLASAALAASLRPAGVSRPSGALSCRAPGSAWPGPVAAPAARVSRPARSDGRGPRGSSGAAPGRDPGLPVLVTTDSVSDFDAARCIMPHLGYACWTRAP